MSDASVNPWRGTTFPRQPIPGQMFFLDVGNDNDPPRGWYEFRTTIGTKNSAGTWTLTSRATGDRGDLVRPQYVPKGHH